MTGDSDMSAATDLPFVTGRLSREDDDTSYLPNPALPLELVPPSKALVRLFLQTPAKSA